MCSTECHACGILPPPPPQHHLFKRRFKRPQCQKPQDIQLPQNAGSKYSGSSKCCSSSALCLWFTQCFRGSVVCSGIRGTPPLPPKTPNTPFPLVYVRGRGSQKHWRGTRGRLMRCGYPSSSGQRRLKRVLVDRGWCPHPQNEHLLDHKRPRALPAPSRTSHGTAFGGYKFGVGCQPRGTGPPSASLQTARQPPPKPADQAVGLRPP